MLKQVAIIKVEWIKSDGDTSICRICKEPIFGNMYTMALVIISKRSETTNQTEMRLCESCHSMLK